ncbi:amino acid adenylation domain-containing protein, partial [Bradyrhizobium sp. SZCCHNS1012]|uniref:amino acid adenylation domain-containing protein n=1 Tax=Bradyrhizobium sp. SZCCHNS1012 TaxID=3057297 RepID=UPI002916A803
MEGVVGGYSDEPWLPIDTCLHVLIEAQAGRAPEAEALRYADTSLSYAELDRRSNRCAQYLRRLGVGPGVIVGVLMERSLELPIALLGVLKAGGAYLPLDPGDPMSRLAFMLDDACVRIILTQERFKSSVADFRGTVRSLDEDRFVDEMRDDPVPPMSGPDDLAYVIYTSGSTGKPKGCMLSHRAICNRLLWMQEMYGLSASDRVLQKTPYTFDVSVWEFFWPLLAGATLMLAAPQGHKDVHYLTETIRREGITVCHFVPSMLGVFLENDESARCDTLRHVFVSGEALPFDLVQRFKSMLRARLHNLYGPTEAAVDVSYWECEERADRKVPIGRAITNIELYILNQARERVSVGEEGELYIAGVGLARGYLNRPELTLERFVANPFGGAGERMYRTGDRVRELADGNIEFLGRTDFQVKVRGLRIELGEIEATLREHPGIKEAVVVVRDEEDGDPKLVAYISGAPLAAKEVRDFVGRRLPDHMVPNAVASLARLPLTRHGKLDRDALPWPVTGNEREAAPPALSHRAVAMATTLRETTERIGEHVARLLKGVSVGADDDLFDLGATSLTLVRVAEWVQQEFGVVVPVNVFLDEPTVRSIGTYVAAQDSRADADESQAASERVTLVPPNYVRAQRIALERVEFRSSAYLPAAPRIFGMAAVPLEEFSSWLGVLRSANEDGTPRYLHASAGGLNAVRTYVVIKADGVQDLAAGVYYYHPEANALYRVGDAARLDRSVFHEYYKAAFDSAGFAVFFIAALEAIVPIYQQSSAVLVTVESGYMGQLLLSRQSRHGLSVLPVASVDFDRIRTLFALGESERFVHCLLGGSSAGDDTVVSSESLLSYIRRTGTSLSRHYQHRAGSSACLRHLSPNLPAEPSRLTQEVIDQLHAERRYLRRIDRSIESHPLRDNAFPWDDYRLRACRREYEPGSVPLAALSRLLALCSPQPNDATRSYLYGSASGQHGLMIYLYVRDGRVQGLSEGVYAYDGGQHALERVGDLAAAQMEQAYTPFNRRHYKNCAFCLFVVGRRSPELDEESAVHLSLLDAGYLGQLLMERQAEFGLGLCPIGGLRFERVRASFALEEGVELLHGFTGGVFNLETPAGREALETRRLTDSTATGMAIAIPPRAQSVSPQFVAIVGLSGRYPGARTLDQYWENLKTGTTSIQALPDARRSLLSQGPVDGIYSGAYLEDIDCFDSLLFGISPAEARTLDPQERLLLESAWSCLEDAGYTAQALLDKSPRTGVFVGAMWNDYQSHGVQAWQARGTTEEFSQHSSLANRISYIFNFSGPSVALNTSCSSGMTALHFACESIKRGESTAALVGSVNLVSHAYHAQLLSTINFLSKDELCRPFSAQANGWILGEGVGTVLLKPLEAALQDGDHIYGVIRGSAIGHSGRTTRFGVPNAKQQAQCIRQALASAHVSPSEISYIEAAAAGASIADAAEMNAIYAVFGGRSAADPCYVGTVKANIGHLESASAFSQLTKVLAQLQHQQLAPSLHSQPRNPLIALEDSGLSIVEQLVPWPNHWTSGKEAPRRALINVIGAVGSEGHLVLEEHVLPARSRGADKLIAIPLSSATPGQLREQVQQLQGFLTRHPDTELTDIAYTLATGRVSMVERLVLVAQSTSDLRDGLRRYLSGEQSSFVYQGCAQPTELAPLVTRDPHGLAAAWVQGHPVDWAVLFDGRQRRVSLPTYPFEPVRHWLGRAAGQTLSMESGQTPALPVQALPIESCEAPMLLQEKMQGYLRRLLSRVSEVPLSRLDVDASLEGYGLSSLMVQTLNTQLEETFGGLSRTLFFEYPSLRQLAAYFVEQHSEAIGKLFGIDEPVALRPSHALGEGVVLAPQAEALVAKEAEAGIAVIALSGRYPGADTLEEYWSNLRQGVDSIREIPPERWDH